DDLALLLSVLAGPVPGNHVGHETPGAHFAQIEPVSLAGTRFALSTDLGGAFEVDHQVAGVVRAQRAVLESLGAVVDDAAPDLAEAEDTFRTLRAWHFQASYGELLAAHPEEFKVSLADNIRLGENQSGQDIARAHSQRPALAPRMAPVFDHHDAPLLPGHPVP